MRVPAHHLPARALQWQAGRSRSGPARRTAGGEAGGLVLWNAGPPSSSRDRDGIGRCELFGIRCCHLSISGTIYFASEYDKSGLGQGIMVFEEGKARIL